MDAVLSNVASCVLFRIQKLPCKTKSNMQILTWYLLNMQWTCKAKIVRYNMKYINKIR